MSDLLELARGLHKQAAEKKEGGKLAGTAAGLATYAAGAKTSILAHNKINRSGGRSKAGMALNALGAMGEFGAIPVGLKVKRSLEKSAAKKDEPKNALRPGVVAGLATAAAGTTAANVGNAMAHRGAATTVRNSYRDPNVDRKNVKGFYENGKYVKSKTPGLQPARIKAVKEGANKLIIKGNKVRKAGIAGLVAAPVVGALVGKAHRMMSEKKDK